MSTVQTPSGEQYILRDPASDAVAVVTEVGATLRSFSVGGRDVISSFAADRVAPASHGAVLVPWPNRIRDGRYSFDGVTYQLPLTEPARGTALHGLVNWQRWRVVTWEEQEVRLAIDPPPIPGYPFGLHVEIGYRLSGQGLEIELVTTNTGTHAAPYGVGFHPWLSPGPDPLDVATLSLDATGWVRPDDRLLPTGVEDLPEHLDFRNPRELGDVVIDDAFTGATRDDDGLSWIRLTGRDGRTAAVWMDESLCCWQMCTGDEVADVALRRSGIAAEPMTCVADAFNTGDDLVRLEPGAEHRVRWGLRLD
ncbi:Aldose 1-epimerase [Beutenbergia cavernae DSM 12333]|uniref:Aldose 1-epimerase n=1 Tax=Beutenbergia cavernae (strain ATCC BAA-8 / DSM 12333 / CCUG 43141 / JCM 11478 / NBRC 16432 / NCIMB 13614 / HKI 0122) TaxID=471853 RepID=C5C1S0_BEUC1|nr:aldose 1-epimerase family protein [Beutenbergia cavernae]ACQ79538.1 Aldose 1-epimerase [Beutenbergia cavernae DSM 12333]